MGLGEQRNIEGLWAAYLVFWQACPVVEYRVSAPFREWVAREGQVRGSTGGVDRLEEKLQLVICCRVSSDPENWA